MNFRNKLRFRTGDVLAIIIVIFMIAGTWLLLTPGGNVGTADSADVYMDGELVMQLPLGEDGQYTVSGRYVNTITVSDGRVSITDSDCPGGDCMHSGAIDSAGRSIVCLPNRVEVRINGAGSKDEVDFVVG